LAGVELDVEIKDRDRPALAPVAREFDQVVVRVIGVRVAMAREVLDLQLAIAAVVVEPPLRTPSKPGATLPWINIMT